MGYFNGLASAFFKKDSLGRTIYFPYGIIGRGRIIESEHEYKRIKKIIKWRYITAIATGIISGVTIERIGWPLAPIILTIGVVDWVGVLLLARHYQISEERMSYVEALRNSAKGYGKGTLWTCFVISLLMTGIFCLMFKYQHGALVEKIMHIALILVLGACTFLWGWMIQLRRQE